MDLPVKNAQGYYTGFGTIAPFQNNFRRIIQLSLKFFFSTPLTEHGLHLPNHDRQGVGPCPEYEPTLTSVKYMSVRSYSLRSSRRVPQQERGERRLAALVDAAACVIGDVGYEAATMSEIASRAGACIGSLYQFFPNKQSITQAVRAEYGARIKERWEALEQQTASLTLEQVIAKLIDSMIEFMEENPAFLQLLDAPCSTRNPSMRALVRQLVARILSSKMRLSPPKLMRVTTVALQILKASKELYAEVSPEERRSVVREFKLVLVRYLSAQPGVRRSEKRSNKK